MRDSNRYVLFRYLFDGQVKATYCQCPSLGKTAALYYQRTSIRKRQHCTLNVPFWETVSLTDPLRPMATESVIWLLTGVKVSEKRSTGTGSLLPPTVKSVFRLLERPPSVVLVFRVDLLTIPPNPPSMAAIGFIPIAPIPPIKT